MSFVTKDGFCIESEDSHELIVPHAHRSKLNIIDDWSGTPQEEWQKIVEDYINNIPKAEMDEINKKYGDLIG